MSPCLVNTIGVIFCVILADLSIKSTNPVTLYLLSVMLPTVKYFRLVDHEFLWFLGDGPTLAAMFPSGDGGDGGDGGDLNQSQKRANIVLRPSPDEPLGLSGRIQFKRICQRSVEHK